MKFFMVTFEYVDPNDHPEHYCTFHGSHPAAVVDEIPEDHWRITGVAHTLHADAVGHMRSLNQLARRGELIRNISKFCVEPGVTVSAVTVSV